MELKFDAIHKAVCLCMDYERAVTHLAHVTHLYGVESEQWEDAYYCKREAEKKVMVYLERGISIGDL